MKLGVNIILVTILFCAYCTKAQEEEITDPSSDAESTPNFPDEFYQDDTKRAGRMSGGTKVTFNDYPYTISVRVYDSKGVRYDNIGVIVGNKLVLSTASAVDPSKYPGGISSKQFSFADMSVGTFITKVDVHPSYNPVTSEFDVAVYTSALDINNLRPVQPIQIESNEITFSPTSTTNCFTLGRGLDSNRTLVTDMVRVNYALADAAKCGAIPSSMVCAESVSGNICYGDTGVPLICNGRVYGIYPMKEVCSSPHAFVKMTDPTIRSFLTPLLPASTFPAVVTKRKNYLTCPCQSC